MKKFAIAAVAALSLASSSAVYAQYHRFSHHMQRMSQEDRAAFIDARLAKVHAGLKLNADQEKLWPPVEAAVRDLAKARMDRATARMKARQDEGKKTPDDPVTRLHQRADNMAAMAAGLKKIADAADPLYKTLDEGQKRRLTLLIHKRGFGGREGWRNRFMERMDRRGGGMDEDESGRL